ncbi:MAG: hypothetical protein NVS9B1_19350 [Candidatus Dormibacteraceae bacterium]
MEQALCPVLVGRESELDRLEERLRRATEGQGGTVVVGGEAGIGKSRLLIELARSANAAGFACLRGACSEAELSLPYLPFLAAVGNFLPQLDIPGRPLGPFRRELARLFPDLDPNPAVIDPSDPAQGRLRLFEAFVTLFRFAGRERPLLVVIEDLQWADPSTRELFDYITRRAQGLRLLLAATCRTGDVRRGHVLGSLLDGWRRGQEVEVIELDPLSPEATLVMVRETVGLERVPVAYRDVLQARSGGNPFVLEEMLKAAADAGWEATAVSRLPSAVADGVLGRLARLPREQAEVIERAAVLGLEFDHRALVAMSGGDDGVVRGALQAALRLQLLEEIEVPPDAVRYRFRHALTWEAIYQDVLKLTRWKLHGDAADILATLPESTAIDRCRHLLAANRGAEAAPLCLLAARDAERTHSFAEAAELSERALPHLDAEGDQGDLSCRLGAARLRAGFPLDAQRHLEAGIALLEASGRGLEAAQHRLDLALACWQRGQLDRAEAELDAARGRLRGEDLALVHARLAQLHVVRLEGEQAVEEATIAIAMAEAEGAEAVRIQGCIQMGAGLAQLGRLDDGLEYLDRAYAEAHALQQDLVAADALYDAILWRALDFRAGEAMLGVDRLRRLQAGNWSRREADVAEGMTQWWCLGEPAPALDALERALAPAREVDAATWVSWTELNLAAVNGMLGRFDEAHRLLAGQVDPAEPHLARLRDWCRVRLAIDSGHSLSDDQLVALAGDPDGLPPILQRILIDISVEAFLTDGRLALAQDTAGRLPRPLTGHPYEERAIGRVAAAEGDATGAAERLRAAAVGFAALGARHEEGRSRIALAAVLAASDPTAAEGELRAALASARERRAHHEEDLARAGLAALGLAGEPTPDQVKAALKVLDKPARLALSPLAALRSLPDGGDQSAALRALLISQIDKLLESRRPAEVDMGRLLRDYYLNRAGTHEQLMAKAYMEPSTWFRRQDEAMELIASDLAERERAATAMRR